MMRRHAAASRQPAARETARDVKGRSDALNARMAYIPDINLTFSFTGTVSQAVSAMVMLLTNQPRIHGMIDEAAGDARELGDVGQTRSDAGTSSPPWSPKCGAADAHVQETISAPSKRRQLPPGVHHRHWHVHRADRRQRTPSGALAHC
jgi:hypothetical protein